jgi:hypothetical protein
MADERDDDQISGDEHGGANESHLGTKGKEGSFGGQSAGQSSSDGMSGQPIGGNDSNTGSGTTLTQGADFGGSTLGTSQTAGGSSGVSGGEGFIGSQGAGSDNQVERPEDSPDSAASAGATDGSDFAKQGRGALEEEDEESGPDSTGGSV